MKKPFRQDLLIATVRKLGRGGVGAAFVLALTGSPAARADDGDSQPALAVQAPLAQRLPHWDAAWSHSNAWDYSLAAVGASFSVVSLSQRTLCTL